MLIRKFGRELDIITQIKKDGSGMKKVEQKHIDFVNGELFDCLLLSITEKTYVACGCFSYVVKFK